jgi:hypothetical protein
VISISPGRAAFVVASAPGHPTLSDGVEGRLFGLDPRHDGATGGRLLVA